MVGVLAFFLRTGLIMRYESAGIHPRRAVLEFVLFLIHVAACWEVVVCLTTDEQDRSTQSVST